MLLEAGCIPSRTRKDIAHFLLNTEGLSKKQIGEFLGEGYALYPIMFWPYIF
jgi:Sec7-like guanine-nucleotide exchange factor